MGQDFPKAAAAKKRMLAANPDTGMEVPQSPQSIAAAADLLMAVFGPNAPKNPARKPTTSMRGLTPQLTTDVLRAFETHPDLVERVDWTGEKIPEKGTRAFLMPGSAGIFGFGKTRDRINLSPEFANQIDNVWHELSHVLGLEDFRGNPAHLGVTSHDVTEASRRVNRQRARTAAVKDKLP